MYISCLVNSGLRNESLLLQTVHETGVSSKPSNVLSKLNSIKTQISDSVYENLHAPESAQEGQAPCLNKDQVKGHSQIWGGGNNFHKLCFFERQCGSFLSCTLVLLD